MYSLRQSMALAWGKLRRAFLVTFRKGRVAKKLERRRGACSRCGACCKLLFNCPAYDDADGNPKCLVYNDRPGVCGLFPLDEKDLRERDIIMPAKKCGFWFEDPPADGAPVSVREAMPLRWGPTPRTEKDPPDPVGKPVWMKGSLAILWAQYRKKEADDGPATGQSANGDSSAR
jgi:hypothetical protein